MAKGSQVCQGEIFGSYLNICHFYLSFTELVRHNCGISLLFWCDHGHKVEILERMGKGVILVRGRQSGQGRQNRVASTPFPNLKLKYLPVPNCITANSSRYRQGGRGFTMHGK